MQKPCRIGAHTAHCDSEIPFLFSDFGFLLILYFIERFSNKYLLYAKELALQNGLNKGSDKLIQVMWLRYSPVGAEICSLCLVIVGFHFS